MIVEKLRAFVEAMPENKTPKAGLRMSGAGDCQRLMEFEGIHGKKSITFEQYIRMETGQHMHNMIRDLVKWTFGDDVYGVEEELRITTPGGLTILGHPDGIIRSQEAVLEFKAVSDSTFQMIASRGAPLVQHIDQGNMYAVSAKVPWVLVVYLNKDFPKFQEFMFETSTELAQKVMDKFDRVNKNIESRALSERPYRDKTESPCWFCSYKEECYAGFTDEIRGLGRAVIDDPGLLEKVRSAILHRNTRLVSEKLEARFKTEVGEAVVSLGLREARFPEGETVSVIVGKNDNLLCNIKDKKEKK